MQFIRDTAVMFAMTLWHVLPWLALMGAVFSLLSLFTPCNAGKPWWRKKGLVTDLTYLFIPPVFMRYARIGFAIIIAVYIVGTPAKMLIFLSTRSLITASRSKRACSTSSAPSRMPNSRLTVSE